MYLFSYIGLDKIVVTQSHKPKAKTQKMIRLQHQYLKTRLLVGVWFEVEMLLLNAYKEWIVGGGGATVDFPLYISEAKIYCKAKPAKGCWAMFVCMW